MPEQFERNSAAPQFKIVEGVMFRVLTDAQSKQVRDLLQQASARKEEKKFVVEGPHLVIDAIRRVQDRVQMVIVTEQAVLQDQELWRAVSSVKEKVYLAAEKLAAKLSDTRSPQGAFAVLTMNEASTINGALVLAFESLQDPGNLGTIIRSAGWFGVRDIILSRSSVDLYNPKVLRATQGAVFESNILQDVLLTDTLRKLRDEGYAIIATLLDESAKDLYHYTFPPKCVVVFGSEAHGLSEEIQQLATDRVIIPRRGFGESLNVAISSAVMLAEWSRQQA